MNEATASTRKASQIEREARLFERLEGNVVRCCTCERRCIIEPGGVGYCRTRRNVNGVLYTIVYGDIASISANPIEKKPFFHFWPGSTALTIGTWGCNFPCPWCQNWELSKARPDPHRSNFISPERLVMMALQESCQGVSVSFNEPTLLLEYNLDIFHQARDEGLYNTLVSNGYMTVEALRALNHAGMDAVKFDVKGDQETYRKYCNADVDVVWRNIREAKRLGMHVEVVTLVIPGLNDDEESIRSICERHLIDAGAETPLHFTRFQPAYKMTDRPSTPIRVLEKALALAWDQGILYVYLGNVPGHANENTYCHNCGELIIQRYGFQIVHSILTQNSQCPKCGEQIPVVGRITV